MPSAFQQLDGDVTGISQRCGGRMVVCSRIMAGPGGFPVGASHAVGLSTEFANYNSAVK